MSTADAPPPPLPRLYAIVDVDAASQAGRDPRNLGVAFLSGGARLLQLRAKHMESGPFADLATAMAADARDAGARLVVNDRADVAVAANAAGVHVGQDDLPAGDARRLVGEERLVGLSTHTAEQIHAASGLPLSYLAIGPMFATTTKDTGHALVEPALLETAREVAETRRWPLVAIGGITLETAPRLIDAGVVSVAVIADLLHDDPEARVRAYIAALR